MRAARARRMRRTLACAVLGLFALLLGYAIAGLIGGAIPANRDWTPPSRGIPIWVESNGVHTALILPVVAAEIDWRDLVRAQDLADPRYAGYDHLGFGWGERRFYLETPTWSDVRPATVLAAALGSDRTLVHVDHLPAPAPGDGARRILLRPAEYRRLADFIRASFRARAGHVRGYGAGDAFYDATGHYSAITTCNSWTGAALRHAGVRVGAWTPFAATVMWWF